MYQYFKKHGTIQPKRGHNFVAEVLNYNAIAEDERRKEKLRKENEKIFDKAVEQVTDSHGRVIGTYVGPQYGRYLAPSAPVAKKLIANFCQRCDDFKVWNRKLAVEAKLAKQQVTFC